MKTTRIKATSLRSRAEFDQTIDNLARLTVELRAAQAERDEKLQAVRAKHDGPCAALEAEIEGLALAAEKYAEANREDLLPGKAKSAETALAIFGFRLGQLAAHDPLRLNAWVPLALPGGAVQCVNPAERDVLLALLAEGGAS